MYKEMAAGFYTLDLKYRISWECAELLIKLAGGAGGGDGGAGASVSTAPSWGVGVGVSVSCRRRYPDLPF